MPYVHLTSPGRVQSCPKRAACWSPRIPATGIAGAEDARIRVGDMASARHDLGQHRGRHAQSAAELLVPAPAADVHEHRARGVADVGDVPSAARQLPDEPGVDRAGGEMARGRLLPRPGNVVEQPSQLRARKVRVEQKPGLAADRALEAGPAHPLHQARGAAILPDDRVVHGLSRLPVPEHDRLALVRDADRRDRRPRRRRPPSGPAGPCRASSTRSPRGRARPSPARGSAARTPSAPRRAGGRARRRRSRASCSFPGRGRGCRARTRF